ncbi:DUF4160 domain-containing protein [Alterisphingorhabdus coralli]|uniref:DUF4160 domain-containing protein n=1 Tax=Alterisphingorhabdus coralli TaxID=3071408 RepID=A0AA97F632_9SPHN|nr:DUF4160 domain-containing protein [Parasphingorhabdus sp. SCSIO 66989]WOE75024.1 DUF4160 domain-containing protein [Parasphingorhabdus sp. SCSIO 66989]
MPTVFRLDGYRFFFYSNEGEPLEPVHIHVIKDGIEAKFWLYPDVRPAYNHGFDARALRKLSMIIEDHAAEIEEAWHDHFG